MTYETILFSIEGGIARITLNRPDRLNSFTTRCTKKCARRWMTCAPIHRCACCS
jgi:enoyl-CoA hydratase/carnithine racemase